MRNLIYLLIFNSVLVGVDATMILLNVVFGNTLLIALFVFLLAFKVYLIKQNVTTIKEMVENEYRI